MRFGAQDRIRVMMKSIIRYIPGPGWSMLLLNYPYIDRNWATDQQKLRKQIKSYTEVKQGSWFCMFPEGTALFKNTLASSQHFAKEKNLPIWQYVLHPRVKGFDLCVKEQNPDYILDVTIGYPELQNGVRPSPVCVFRLDVWYI
jgi:lysocardiolipin and lysophospholipid acyltransferase